jgi:hypothetical protein
MIFSSSLQPKGVNQAARAIRYKSAGKKHSLSKSFLQSLFYALFFERFSFTGFPLLSLAEQQELKYASA